MPLGGVDRRTGAVISNWEDTKQSIEVILTTQIGDRVMRRNFGSAVPGLLGKNLTPQNVMRFYMAIAIAIELWEPRFLIRQVLVDRSRSSEDDMRAGRLGFQLYGDFRPNALSGDFTVASPQIVSV